MPLFPSPDPTHVGASGTGSALYSFCASSIQLMIVCVVFEPSYLLAETNIVLCSSLKLLLHQIIWLVIFLAKTCLLAVVPNCLLNMPLSCDSNTILVRGSDALVCSRCCILVPLTVMCTCFLPSVHGSNAVVLFASIVSHHNLAVLTIMLVPICHRFLYLYYLFFCIIATVHL